MNEPGLQDQDLRNILNEMTTLSKSENSKVSLNGLIIHVVMQLYRLLSGIGARTSFNEGAIPTVTVTVISYCYR